MKEDKLLELCIKQGYVKESCQLPGEMVIALVNSNMKPCEGCSYKNKCDIQRSGINERSS